MTYGHTNIGSGQGLLAADARQINSGRAFCPLPSTGGLNVDRAKIFDRPARVSESFQVRNAPWLMEKLLWLAMPAHRDRTTDLAEDLGRFKVLVESGDCAIRQGDTSRP
jgi:hypothetical protein